MCTVTGGFLQLSALCFWIIAIAGSQGKLATYTQRPPPSSTPPSVARQADRTSSAPGNGTDQLYPFFDYYVPRNITTTIGQSAFLHCRTENLNDKSVSWMRKRDLHILTAGVLTYTSDQRFQVIHPDNSDNWTLLIKFAQPRDAGIYECQVNTEPKMSLAFQLNVVASLDKAKSKLPKAMIKSDVSCTEDENFNRMPLYNSKRNLSPKSKRSKKVKLNSENQHASSSIYPPQYTPVKDTMGPDIFDLQSNINQISNDSGSNSSSDFDDSDKDQTWTMKQKKHFEHDFDETSPLKVTPKKSIQSPDFIMTSPSGQWRVSTQIDINKYHTNNSDKSKTTSKLHLTEFDNLKDSTVKRQLKYPIENQNMISEMRARICGPQEMYVKEDSEVSMRCELSQGPHDLGTIFWYLGNVPVYTDQASLQSIRQPRVSVHTEWVDGLKSTLHIARAKLADSGNYTCMPTFGQSATINVHVVNGEHPAAMQHGNRSAVSGQMTVHVLALFSLVIMLSNPVLFGH